MKLEYDVAAAPNSVLDRILSWFLKLSPGMALMVDGCYVAMGYNSEIRLEHGRKYVGLGQVRWSNVDHVDWMTRAFFEKRKVDVQVVGDGLELAFDGLIGRVGCKDGKMNRLELVGEEWTVTL